LIEKLDRHKFHIEALEKILRAVESDQLSHEVVLDIKDDINEYVSNYNDETYEENSKLYDVIPFGIITPVEKTEMKKNSPPPEEKSHPKSGKSRCKSRTKWQFDWRRKIVFGQNHQGNRKQREHHRSF